MQVRNGVRVRWMRGCYRPRRAGIYIYMREGALGVRVQQVYCVYGGADCPVLVVVSRPLFPFSPTLPVSTVSTDRRRLVSSAAIVSGLELKASPPLSLVQVAGAFAARFE